MRYVRMLTNAMAAGALAATYITVLLLQLNPRLPLASAETAAWFRVLLSFYGLHTSIAIFAMLVVRDMIAARALAPAWISVRLIAWMAALLAGGAAAGCWLNLRGFRAVLGEDAARGMAEGASALTAAALLLAAVAIARYSFGRRGGRVAAAVLALIIAGSIAAPLSARASIAPPLPVIAERLDVGAARGTGTLRLVMLDGAALGFIRERIGTGRLPTFARVLERGATLDLASLKPTQPEPVWAAAATGKYPTGNGVRSAARFRAGRGEALVDILPDYCFAHALVYLGYVASQPVESTDLRARPLWSITSAAGVRSGIVRWPVSFPVAPLDGFVVSDRFHLTTGSPLRTDQARAAFPHEAVVATRAVFDASMFNPWPEVLPAALPADAPAGGVTPVRWDRIYAEARRALEQHRPVRLSAIRYQGVDTVAHTFLRYAQPHLFSEGSSADAASFGLVLDRYYGFIDGEIAREIAQLQPGDLLLVISGFGMEPVTLPKRALAKLLGEPDLSGTHERAPDGFLLAYGSDVAPGTLPRGAIVDLAPTVLYYLGLPVARDMDGYARTDLFTRAFTASRPVTYIRTYE
ncbi:MAG: alkaline phosphatase family protein [Acidobacteriota bacterium]|nr:alkaline phosphatase family protein [Acidobacteriota bacterium]